MADHDANAGNKQRSYSKSLPGVDRSKAARIYIDGYYKNLLEQTEQRQKRFVLILYTIWRSPNLVLPILDSLPFLPFLVNVSQSYEFNFKCYSTPSDVQSILLELIENSFSTKIGKCNPLWIFPFASFLFFLPITCLLLITRVTCRQEELEELAKNLSKKEKKELEMALAAAESEYFRRSRRKMKVTDFVNIKLIGRGAFGEV